MMKSRKWIFAPAFVAVALASATLTHSVNAQPDTTAKKAGKRGQGRRTPMITPMMLEKILGKPLTGEQKEAVAAAAKTYQESVAKAVGLSPAELNTKAKAYRKTQRAAKPAA